MLPYVAYISSPALDAAAAVYRGARTCPTEGTGGEKGEEGCREGGQWGGAGGARRERRVESAALKTPYLGHVGVARVPRNGQVAYI